MEDKSDSRDSDSSWVLEGGEGLPIDTVGPEHPPDLGSSMAEDEEPEEEEEEEEEEGTQDTVTAVTANGAAAFPGQTRHRCPQDPEQHLEPEAVAVPAPGGPAEPGVTEGGEPEELDAETVLGPRPDTPVAGPPTEESCTSSDNDVEGLRRRQGHQPCPTPPRPAPAAHRRTADGGAEDGLGVSTYLLGALALVAVALLIVTSGIYDLVEDPVESAVSRDAVAGEQEPPPPADGNDSQQDPRVSDPGDPQSLTSVTLLLDKLAKENQEIRLMQAELQAHKEELQALLRKSEGEAVAAGAQQQSLAAENARLRAALERDAAALHDARAELQRLQAVGTAGSPGAGEPVAAQPPGTGATSRASEERGPRQGWLAAVRQELVGALERARGPGGLEGLVEELSALEQRLGREAEAAEPFPGHRKKPPKAEKKESKRHRRHGTGGPPPERERREQGKPHGPRREPREHQAGRAWEKPSHGPHEPLLSRSRAPRGCSGVADCARKEGLEVLGRALEPVHKGQFLGLLGGFMSRWGWGQHFEEVARRVGGAFGAAGTFAHDRLRFVDFVGDVEELLEAVARREGGDAEAADGFEEHVLSFYGGDRWSAGKKKRGWRAPRQHGRGG